MKSFYIIITLFTLIIVNLSAQTYRELSKAEQNQVDRLNEMAELYINDNDAENAGLTYSRIAFIYWKAGKPREAIDNFISSSEYYLQKNKFNEVKNIYSNLGVIYTDLEELEFALEYFKKSLTIRRKIGDKKDIAAGLIDVAYILQAMGYYDDANEYLNEALSISTKQKNSKLILDCYQMLATNYDAMGNIKKANEYNNKAESFQNYIQEQSIKQEYTEQIIETKQEVVKTEREKELAKELFLVKQKLYMRQKDSFKITIQSKQDSLFRAAQLAKLKQKEVENLLNKQKVQELTIKEQEAKAKNQRLTIIMITGGFILMIFLAFVMLRANQQRKKANIKLEKQNKEIEEKSAQLSNALKKIAHQNQNIKQSINYAKGIQQAMLPKPEQFNKLFKDSFILFKPRDIVSGDFYYFKDVDAKSDIFKIFGMHRLDNTDKKEDKTKEKKIVISAVDCTGHGVPGAFMSMIGYNLLEDITFKGITRPDLILEEMHRGVRTALKQKETNNQDGMDMAVCVIDVKKKTMDFAGAKNPIIYIQDDKITQIKGDKDGIGGKSDDHKFKYHTIDISKLTYVYLFSDGYIDQFGGTQGRKFMIKRFRELLFDIHSKPMKEQRDFLDKTFVEWIGKDYNQIDDVLVMGFKIDLS